MTSRRCKARLPHRLGQRRGRRTGSDPATLERVQDGAAVDTILTSEVVHAPADLVLLGDLCYLGGSEAPLVPALARCAVCATTTTCPSMQSGPCTGFHRESFC